MLNKDYLPYFISIFAFIIIMIFSVMTYVNWDKPASGQYSSLEVNLPVIDWNSYSALSKQYRDDTISEEK